MQQPESFVSETPHEAAVRRKRERTLFGMHLAGKTGMEIGPLSQS